jgi:uncharacterized protein (TIGR03085 family)
MSSLAAEQRQALADALVKAGPDAATLCEGWTAQDLAAHLVSRESRPDAGLGLVLPPFAGWTDRILRQYARRPFAQLVDSFRGGPPRLSMFALPGVDAMANTVEYFVHTEDVLRAQPDWAPRPLPAPLQAALWKALCRQGKLMFRKAPVGVLLATPDGRSETVRAGSPVVTLTGEPSELILHAFGRSAHASVRIDGSESAVAALAGTRLGL